jgi:hypothetical protein
MAFRIRSRLERRSIQRAFDPSIRWQRLCLVGTKVQFERY